METKLAQPFTNIAVSLSGGGYRATAFHLGALSYLHSLQYKGQNMLQRVTVLSTISGGTLTGVMFALYLAKGRTFEDSYKKLYDLLSEDKLLERALGKLNNTKAWNDKTKSKDLINAFSEVYNEHFFEDERFSTLFSDETSHLKDVIFGATEFTTGIQFRFTENDDKGKFGNGKLNLSDDVAAGIRLGDAAAASSCFPGGFEPIIMTKDFAGSPDGPIATAWKSKGYPTTGIMDGGIIDNQGIEGVELAEQRHRKKGDPHYIGTYIISDVSSRIMDPYQVPTIKYSKFKDFFTFNSVNLIFALIVAFIIATLFFCPAVNILGSVLLSSILTIAVIWFGLFLFVRSFVMTILYDMIGKPSTSHIFKDFNVILKTPLYILAYLLRVRATSVIKMVSDIFLRRIRSLQITQLFSDKKWNYRITTNNIYSLQDPIDPKLLTTLREIYDLPKGEEPLLSTALAKVINEANNMPTTLWFTDEERKNNNMLDSLIACGQFTMCFNLIDYIRKMKSNKGVWEILTPATKQEIEELHLHLKNNFKLFNENPLRMVK